MNDLAANKPKWILFDLDGTLWDSGPAVAEAWNSVLAVELPEFPPLTTDDVHAVMGRTMEELANILFKDYPPEKRMDLLIKCESMEAEVVSQIGGILWPGVRETLEELIRRGYKLAIISNCQTGYIPSFYSSMHMEQYFADYQEWGSTRLVKGENIKVLMNRNGIAKEDAVYIGDTQGDCNAADLAGIPFYHANYGFGGPVTHCAAELNKFNDLLDLFR